MAGPRGPETRLAVLASGAGDLLLVQAVTAAVHAVSVATSLRVCQWISVSRTQHLQLGFEGLAARLERSDRVGGDWTSSRRAIRSEKVRYAWARSRVSSPPDSETMAGYAMSGRDSSRLQADRSGTGWPAHESRGEVAATRPLRSAHPRLPVDAAISESA